MRQDWRAAVTLRGALMIAAVVAVVGALVTCARIWAEVTSVPAILSP